MIDLNVLIDFGYDLSDTQGAQWFSGRVLDPRPKGSGLEPHRRHCVVSLSKNINPSLILVQPKKTCPFITERLLMGRKESNQTNKQMSYTQDELKCWRNGRSSDSGKGNHSVSLLIILIKIKVKQMLLSSYVSSLLVSIL